MSGLLDLLEGRKVNVSIALMFVLTVVNSFMFYQLGSHMEDVLNTSKDILADNKLEYPMNVIEFGLKDTTSDQEVQEIITMWIETDWGAQIGALETVCDTDPTRLQSLMSPNLTVEVCRRVR